jgi:hypothetical protein
VIAGTMVIIIPLAAGLSDIGSIKIKQLVQSLLLTYFQMNEYRSYLGSYCY